jgi:hypothetical protein
VNVTSAGGDQTLLQAAPAAGLPIYIEQILVSFQGASNTNAPPNVSCVRQTDVGTGGQAVTHKNQVLDDRLSPTVSCAWLGGIWATTEPTDTAGSKIFGGFVHPQTWMLFPIQPGDPIVVDGGNWFGISVNPGADVISMATVYFREGR